VRLRRIKNTFASYGMMVLTGVCGLIVFVIGLGLYFKARPILEAKGIRDLLFSTQWVPTEGFFGFWPFIVGTIWVTAVAVVIAIPLCLLVSIYLSEYAHRRVREWAVPLIDLLAGIPSVIFGYWGVLMIVPLIQDKIGPFYFQRIAPLLVKAPVSAAADSSDGMEGFSGAFSSGYCVLSGGIVLAIMVFPVIINVTVEVFKTVPYEMRQAALSLGATKWQMVKSVVLRKAMPGIIAACVLGLSRAFGETIAVLMVVGNVREVPKSLFDPAYPLPALIANDYGEMMSIPLYDSALLLASLILMAIVLAFNILARVVLVRVERATQ